MAIIFDIALYLSVLIAGVTAQDFVALERDDGYYSASRLLVASTVNQTVKENWCISQLRVCSILCDFNPDKNLCWSKDISCTCICKSNVVPDLAPYIGSLPALVNNFVLQSYECTSNVEYCRSITNATLSATASPRTLPRLPSDSAGQTSGSSQLGQQVSSKSSGLPTGTTAGIGVGCAAGALFVAGVAIFLYRRWSRAGQRKSMLGDNLMSEAELNGAGIEVREVKEPEVIRRESEVRRARVANRYRFSGWGPGGHEMPALEDGQTLSKSGDEITVPESNSRSRGL